MFHENVLCNVLGIQQLKVKVAAIVLKVLLYKKKYKKNIKKRRNPVSGEINEKPRMNKWIQIFFFSQRQTQMLSVGNMRSTAKA